MHIEADRLLLKYFRENLSAVERWFNVISPTRKKLAALKRELKELQNKNWQSILS